MTLKEIKDLILFCKANGVLQLKVGETAFVIDTPPQEIQIDRVPTSPWGE
jgi:hypothetical protein